MPIGLPEVPALTPVRGVQLGTADAGLSKAAKDDLALIKCAASTIGSAAFTRNRFCAAPVLVARQHLEWNMPRALIINSGNANAGTGFKGRQDAARVCRMVADGLDLEEESVLPFSTGVIGARLPVGNIERALPECIAALSENGWLGAARAIMTTDVVPKGSSRRFDLGDTAVTLTGIAKGSGMIHPNMATMLAFIATDAVVSKPLLDDLLQRAVRRSFNRITVDGDTSTNDACVLLATGCADMAPIEQDSDPRCAELKDNLDRLCLELAQALVRDGEGATKFVTIQVTRAANESDARELAFAVAHSPLVKTALFASDPNWGRILAVVGRARIDQLDIDKVNISINDVLVVENGEPAAVYTEDAGQTAMAAEDIVIQIGLGAGETDYSVWTSDLSYDYVKINAEYRS